MCTPVGNCHWLQALASFLKPSLGTPMVAAKAQAAHPRVQDSWEMFRGHAAVTGSVLGDIWRFIWRYLAYLFCADVQGDTSHPTKIIPQYFGHNIHKSHTGLIFIFHYPGKMSFGDVSQDPNQDPSQVTT